jgi:hypothetical protein
MSHSPLDKITILRLGKGQFEHTPHNILEAFILGKRLDETKPMKGHFYGYSTEVEKSPYEENPEQYTRITSRIVYGKLHGRPDDIRVTVEKIILAESTWVERNHMSDIDQLLEKGCLVK